MRVHRVRLCNYRGVTDSAVSFTDAGVTIIEGDNEVGKTSIPEALGLILRFHDSSKHRDVASVQPVHRDAGAEVEVEVTTGPYRFVYSKRWHRRPETRLEVTEPRHEQLTGRQAHDRVVELLDETLDRDLWAVLSITQGAEVALPDFDVTSLGRALDAAAVGDAASAQDDDLWERICAEREKYWTPTGQPKADRKAAERDLAEARGAVADLGQKLAGIEADAAEVERRLLDRTRLEQLRDAAAAQEQELGGRQQELETLRGEAARLTAEHEVAVQKRDRTDDEASQREERIRSLADAVKNVQELQAAGERTEPVLATAGARAAAAAEDLSAADESLSAARAAQRLANEDRDHHRRIIEVEQLRERHARVVEAQNALSEAEAHLESARVDDEFVEQVEQAHLSVVRAEATARAAAASLAVTALADLEVMISGEPVALPAGATHELSVSRDARVTLPGVAQVDVTAGGGSRDRSAEVDHSRALLARLCDEGGVSGLEEARRAAERRKEAERSRREATATISRDRRDLTLEVMEQKIAGLSGRVEAYTADRPSEPALPSDFEEAKQLASAAGGLLAEREDHHERCRRAVEDTSHALAGVEQEEAVRAERVRNAESVRSEVAADLEAARGERSDADLRASLALAQQAADEAADALERAQAAVAKADPESLTLRLGNARAAAARAVAEFDQNEDSLRTVRARLTLQGESGLHQQLDENRSRCEHLERQHERTEARAEAAMLLHDTFERRRAESRRRYLAPFKGRIEQFGRIVFGPSLEVELDDDLKMARRTLDGVTLDVDQLSVGAREQLGVLARLACAAIVSPDGGGAPVIIDDALGWSDPPRLARMGAAIAAAGRECQVIVLTCTPGRYAHVGNAEVVTLAG